MERDESVFLMGEDIGEYGGAFKATKGFQQHFGEDRVIDTVLAEAAIIGAATGAAIVGMRPIAEMQFADFVTCGYNQLVTNAAKVHYRWHLSVPMVVRLPSGTDTCTQGREQDCCPVRQPSTSPWHHMALRAQRSSVQAHEKTTLQDLQNDRDRHECNHR